MLKMFTAKETRMAKIPECGVTCLTVLEGDTIRFLRKAFFTGKVNYTVARERGWRISDVKPNSFTVSKQVLIPVSQAETYPYKEELMRLKEEVEYQMTGVECHKCMWFVGHDCPDDDTIFFDIPLKEGLRYNRLLRQRHPDYWEEQIEEHATVEKWKIPMEDSIIANLKLRSDQDGEPLWTEMVFSESGKEVCFSDQDDSLFGDWMYLDEDNNSVYVTVRLGTAEEWNARQAASACK